MAYTFVEWAKTIEDPYRQGIIETLYTEEKIFQYLQFMQIPGLAYSYTKEETLPAVAFRKLNEAFVVTEGVVNRPVEVLKPYGADSDTDRVLIKAYGEARRTARDQMHAKSMGVKYLQTMLYGNSGARLASAFDDADGFDGFLPRLTSGQIIDAGGTAGSGGTSVFFIRFGETYCSGLETPEGLEVRDLGELASGAPVMRTRIDHTAGLQIAHGKSVSMVQDIEASGADVLTGTMMYQAADLIVGEPDVILMSKRSRLALMTWLQGLGIAIQWTVDQIGKPIMAWNDTPIVVSDAVLNTEVTA